MQKGPFEGQSPCTGIRPTGGKRLVLSRVSGSAFTLTAATEPARLPGSSSSKEALLSEDFEDNGLSAEAGVCTSSVVLGGDAASVIERRSLVMKGTGQGIAEASNVLVVNNRCTSVECRVLLRSSDMRLRALRDPSEAA